MFGRDNMFGRDDSSGTMVNGLLEKRSASYHERYAHIGHNTGFPHNITYLFEYDPSLLPDKVFLEERARELQKRVHHLWMEVVDGDTPNIALQLRNAGPFPASEIVRDDEYQAALASNGVLDGTETRGKLLEKELARMEARARSSGPLWQVTRYLPSSGSNATEGKLGVAIDDKSQSETDTASGIAKANGPRSRNNSANSRHDSVMDGQLDDSQPRKAGKWEHPAAVEIRTVNEYENDTCTGEKAYVAISAYHHLLDGTGGLVLSRALLHPSGSSHDMPYEPGLAPRMEDVIPMAPDLKYAATEAVHELVVPHLSEALRSLISRPLCWPGTAVKGRPTEFPPAQSQISLPAEWIQRLKALGKANGVARLNATLQTAFVLSLWDTVGRPSEIIDCCTLRNERDAGDAREDPWGRKASKAMGVFISTFHKQYNNLSGAASFWQLAREAAKQQRDPFKERNTSPPRSGSLASRVARSQGVITPTKEIQDARYAPGMMAYIPDPSDCSHLHEKYGSDPFRRTPTGWEDFVWSGSERTVAVTSEDGVTEQKPAPIRTSLAFSNLGETVLPPGCINMMWGQSAVPWEDLMLVSVIGHEHGLNVGCAFRDGCGVDRDQVKMTLRAFWRSFSTLLTRGEASEGSEGITVDDVLSVEEDEVSVNEQARKAWRDSVTVI